MPVPRSGVMTDLLALLNAGIMARNIPWTHCLVFICRNHVKIRWFGKGTSVIRSQSKMKNNWIWRKSAKWLNSCTLWSVGPSLKLWRVLSKHTTCLWSRQRNISSLSFFSFSEIHVHVSICLTLIERVAKWSFCWMLHAMANQYMVSILKVMA